MPGNSISTISEKEVTLPHSESAVDDSIFYDRCKGQIGPKCLLTQEVLMNGCPTLEPRPSEKT